MCTIAQRFKKKKNKKKKTILCCVHTNQNILILFFSFLFFSPLFHFYPLLLSTQSSPSSFLLVAADQAPAQYQPLYLAFSFSRSPPQRPNLRAPPTLCYLMPSADVGLCLCFPIYFGQWACVCVCGNWLVFSNLWAFWRN